MDGAGCTAIDPATGAGAYAIEGGSNGAALLVAAIVAVVLVLLGWGVAAAGVTLLVEGIIAVVSIGINSILQKMLGMGDKAQITVSFIELMAAFVLLVVPLLIASQVLVVAALGAIAGAMVGSLWDIFV